MATEDLPVVSWGNKPITVSNLRFGVSRSHGGVIGRLRLTSALETPTRTLARHRVIAVEWNAQLGELVRKIPLPAYGHGVLVDLRGVRFVIAWDGSTTWSLRARGTTVTATVDPSVTVPIPAVRTCVVCRGPLTAQPHATRYCGASYRAVASLRPAPAGVEQ